MGLMNKLSGLSASVMAMLTAGAAVAQDTLPVLGKPEPGGLGFQAAATEIAADTHRLDNFLLYIITAITVFVLILMLIVIFRYNRRMNPNPKSFGRVWPQKAIRGKSVSSMSAKNSVRVSV